MKKNRTMRVAVLMLALTLLTCCFVGSTFAKYTSTVTTKEASVTVAKWDIKVEDQQIAVTGSAPEISFDLFSTILDTDSTSADVDGTDPDVADNKIAPGTKGSFTFNITNDSEVDAEYSITFNGAQDWPTNFVFTVKVGNAAATTANSLADIEKVAIGMGESTTVVIDWEWAFETVADGSAVAGNTADTADGITPVTNTITATILVEQVD